jgi:hypothetical protein
MSFDERYRLLELAGDEGAKTYVAQEISTGKKVTVFLFVGEQAGAQADLLFQLRAVDRAQLPELIETGENRGTPYVVTEPLGSLPELKSCLSRVKVPPQKAPAHKTGEFSKRGVWHVPADLQSPEFQERATKSSQDSMAADPQETAKTSSHGAPGSFTQMFQAAAGPIGEPVTEAPKASAAPAPSAPGSFTQMFQAAAAPIGESAPQASMTATKPAPPKPAQSGPGEFTRFFNAAASPSRAPDPMPHKPESEGDFARLFGSGDRVAAPPSIDTGLFGPSPSAAALKQSQATPAQAPPPSFAQPAGELTNILGSAAAEIPTLDSAASPTPAPGATQAPPASGPGEYTRMFGAQSLLQKPPAEPVPAPVGASEAPAPAKLSAKMIFVLIGVTLLLLAAIAVVLITMGK